MVCNHWFIIFLQIPFAILGKVSMIAAPYYIGKLIDAMTEKDTPKVQAVATEWAIVTTIGAFLMAIKEYIKTVASETLGYELRELFFESIIRKGISFYDSKKTGDICK